MDKNPTPVFGIYERKSGRYWFKVVFMYLLITLKQIKIFFKRHDSKEFQKLEIPQILPTAYEKAADIVTLNGANKDGDHVIVHFGKRHRQLEGFFFLKIKNSNFGVLTSLNFSDSALSKSEHEYASKGLRLIPTVPIKNWRLIYNGTMKELNYKTREHTAQVDGTWISDSPVIESKIDTFNAAKYLSYEKWSKTYFENIKKAYKNQYQQFGILKLKVTIDSTNFDLEFDTVKGHTIGNNIDDSHYYRAAVHQFSSEKGDYFRVSQICAPIYGSRVTEGFVYHSKEKKTYPIKKCSLQLYKYGGIEAHPEDYGFTFVAGDREYAVHVKVTDSPYIYSGQNWQMKSFLKMSKFEINGQPGWGTAKWSYRNIDGRNS